MSKQQMSIQELQQLSLYWLAAGENQGNLRVRNWYG
jgi:hypothetical protein